jgi:hypothetical protein
MPLGLTGKGANNDAEPPNLKLDLPRSLDGTMKQFFAPARIAQFVTRSTVEAVSVWGKKELLSTTLAERQSGRAAERTNKPPSKSAKACRVV